MTKTLVIVESPAKAKKIQKYLGSTYLVKASFGHMLDLPPTRLGVDLTKKDFPLEIVPMKGKQKVIRELKTAFKQCGQKVILAPDPDREGEAIGYYAALCLGIKEPYSIPRIAFQEITKGAIERAVKSPTNLSEPSVKAQMARRALDRILGYKISPIVKKQTLTGRSAGRCQSPALLILQEKEMAIRDFLEQNGDAKSNIRSKMVGLAEGDPNPWEVICDALTGFPKINWMDVAWKIHSSKKGRTTKTNPLPPFITSSLLSTAASRLGYGTGRTKKMIQTMYEKGWITYIRTDSTAISKDAQKQIQEYLKEELELPVVQRGWNGKKSAHAQEAHECIRPTLIKRLPADIDSEFRRLYELIWNRTVESQMEPSESITVSIEVMRKKATKLNLVWTGTKSYCVKPGWKQIEGETAVNPKDIPVPKKNGVWTPSNLIVEETIKQPPHRYNDATFVSQLEKAGIGRPSTYASIVETILARGYAEVKDVEGTPVQCRFQTHEAGKEIKTTMVEKMVGSERKRLIITELGQAVCSFLYPTSDELLGVKATAEMESLLDDISNGEKEYGDVMRDYWTQLQTLLETLTKSIKVSPKSQKSQTSSDGNKLGSQMIDGKEYIIGFEITRFGPAITRVEKGKSKAKKEYGNVPKGVDVSKMTLEDAIQCLPLSLGTWKRKKVIAKKGKYGPYLQVGKDTYVSVPMDVWKSGLDTKKAKFILQQDEAEKTHAIKMKSALEKEGVTDVLKGPRGWYMKTKPKGKGTRGKNVSVGETILDKTEEDLKSLLS